MAYIYAANIWCDGCGETIKERIQAEGMAPADSDEYDSDEYPKHCDGSSEADSPQHCAAGADCINAYEFDDGTKIGVWLENDLTTDGADYVKKVVCEAREGCGNLDVANLWKEYYNWIDFSTILACYGCDEDFDSDDLNKNNLCADCQKKSELWRCPRCKDIVEVVNALVVPYCADCNCNRGRFDPVDTVFLKDRFRGDIFAVFPGIAVTANHVDHIAYYAYIGQHGAATLVYCDECKEMTDPAECADLAAKLDRIGYNVRMVCKCQLHAAKYEAARREQLRL